MKFRLSITSIIAHTSSILFLSFSIPLLGQITVPDDYHECKIINPNTFDSAENILKIAGVPKRCFGYILNQHTKTVSGKSGRNSMKKQWLMRNLVINNKQF